jgi:hypothetical protein
VHPPRNPCTTPWESVHRGVTVHHPCTPLAIRAINRCTGTSPGLDWTGPEWSGVDSAGVDSGLAFRLHAVLPLGRRPSPASEAPESPAIVSRTHDAVRCEARANEVGEMRRHAAGGKGRVPGTPESGGGEPTGWGFPAASPAVPVRAKYSPGTIHSSIVLPVCLRKPASWPPSRISEIHIPFLRSTRNVTAFPKRIEAERSSRSQRAFPARMRVCGYCSKPTIRVLPL